MTKKTTSPFRVGQPHAKHGVTFGDVAPRHQLWMKKLKHCDEVDCGINLAMVKARAGHVRDAGSIAWDVPMT